MSGQIVDATLVAAPKQSNTEAEKADIKAGRVLDHWKDRPARLRKKDQDARWTVKFSKPKLKENGTLPPVDIIIPPFGYKSHASVDHRRKIIRRQKVTDADGARLREGLIDPNNTAGDIWADSAYRSRANETYLDKHDRTSRIHHKEVAKQGDAQGHVANQWQEIESPRRRRARLRRAEASHGPVRPDHRYRQSRGHHHVHQHGLQYEEMVLAGAKNRQPREKNGLKGRKSRHQRPHSFNDGANMDTPHRKALHTIPFPEVSQCCYTSN